MLYPSLASMLKHVDNRYRLVNIIARRARDISTMNYNYDVPDDFEKPVSMAIEEIASGKLRVTVTEDEL